MNKQTSEFADAIEQICAGSEHAVWEFIESYGPHIRRVVRRRLNHKIRSKFDSVDFVQMVWVSFFANPKQIAEFKDPERLIRHLSSMARNKVVDENRRRLEYQRHNVKHELSLEVNSDPTPDRKQDTPSAIAIAKERWESLMDEQPERNREVVELRISGATFAEIGEKLGIDESTARRVISKLSGAPLA